MKKAFFIIFAVAEVVFIGISAVNGILSIGMFIVCTVISLLIAAFLTGRISSIDEADYYAELYDTDRGTGKLIAELEREKRERNNKQ